MCRGERIGERKTRVHERGGVQRAARETLVQRLTIEQFHDEERHGRRADVVDRADPGMVERRDRLGLALEALERLRRGRVGWKDLDGDQPIEARVARAVDLAHATRTQRSEDLVGAEPSAGVERHRFRRSELYERLLDDEA